MSVASGDLNVDGVSRSCIGFRGADLAIDGADVDEDILCQCLSFSTEAAVGSKDFVRIVALLASPCVHFKVVQCPCLGGCEGSSHAGDNGGLGGEVDATGGGGRHVFGLSRSLLDDHGLLV